MPRNADRPVYLLVAGGVLTGEYPAHVPVLPWAAGSFAAVLAQVFALERVCASVLSTDQRDRAGKAW